MSVEDFFKARGLLSVGLPKIHFDRAASESGFHLDGSEDFGKHVIRNDAGDELYYSDFKDGNIVLEQFNGDYENARDFLAMLAPHVSMDSSALWVYEDMNSGDTPWVTTFRDGRMYEARPSFDDLIDAIADSENIKPEVVEMPSRDADPLADFTVSRFREHLQPQARVEHEAMAFQKEATVSQKDLYLICNAVRGELEQQHIPTFDRLDSEIGFLVDINYKKQTVDAVEKYFPGHGPHDLGIKFIPNRYREEPELRMTPDELHVPSRMVRENDDRHGPSLTEAVNDVRAASAAIEKAMTPRMEREWDAR